MKDYEKEYDDFWKEIIENKDGSINLDQVKKELHDFSFMIKEVPKVYDHVTNSRISKPMTHAHAVIGVYDQIIEDITYRCCDTCRHFKHEKGKQIDNMDWETKECEMSIWSMPMEIETDKISCHEWERKK